MSSHAHFVALVALAFRPTVYHKFGVYFLLSAEGTQINIRCVTFQMPKHLRRHSLQLYFFIQLSAQAVVGHSSPLQLAVAWRLRDSASSAGVHVAQLVHHRKTGFNGKIRWPYLLTKTNGFTIR